MAGLFKDLTGLTFGHWFVVCRKGTVKSVPKSSHATWICRCVCGTQRILRTTDLSTGHPASCGCKRGRHQHTRRGYRSPVYAAWMGMKGRCEQPSNPGFTHYKTRGIKICKRWQIFENFLEDMGPLPGTGYTLDRWPDNTGDYKPGNCRWATRQEQANNRVTNVHLTYKGHDFTLAELARETGVSKELLRSRLFRSKQKWTVEGAIATPKGTKGILAC